MATVFQGGTEMVPRSVAGRVLTATMYIFTVIIITSYCANLAAFLTVKAYSNAIQSVDDLADLPENSPIKFGTVRDSGILEFFSHSEMSAYRRIHKTMGVQNTDWLVNNSQGGYLRAMKGEEM